MPLLPGKKPVLDTIRSVIMEECPDVRMDIPLEYLKSMPPVEILGKLEGVLLTIAHQLTFHYNAAISHISSVPGELLSGNPQLKNVLSKVVSGGYEHVVSSVLKGIFWAGIFHDIPATWNIGGDYAIYRGWNVSVIKKQKLAFGRPIFEKDELGHTFYKIASRIICGNNVFDSTSELPMSSEQDLRCVGKLENETSRQMYLLSLRIKKACTELDPWPTVIEEHGHFMKGSFEDYARFYQRRARLNQYNSMMSSLVTVLTLEAIDSDRITDQMMLGAGDRTEICIMGDWDIYMKFS